MEAVSDVSRGSQIYSSVPPRIPLPDPFDLDEVLGFNEALQKRKESGDVIEVKNFDNNKVFINEVDSFCGKYLVLALSRKESMTKNVQLVDDSSGVDGHIAIKEIDKKSESVKVEKDVIQNIPKSVSKKGKASLKSPNNIDIKTIKKKSSAKPVEDVTCQNLKSVNYILEEQHDKFDTTKLTVAEYYEWVELEPGPERNEFLKEKLGKYFEEENLNLPLNSEPMKYMTEITNIQYIPSFKIIGTLKNNVKSEDYVQEGVSEIINLSINNSAYYEQLSKCGYIIYFINDEYKQAAEALSVLNSLLNYYYANSDLSQAGRPLFILVSTFMTWASTKSLDPNDPELPFTEKDYRKRIPHPNYQLHHELEQKLLIAKENNEIESIILTCGITYGHEENVLNYLFETAFNCVDLPIYCSGNNVIPIIHVENLALTIKEVIQRRGEIKMPFLFVKDSFSYPFKDLVSALSNGLGTGCCKIMPEVFAFLNDYISQDIYDQTTVNLNLQSCYRILNEENVQWKYKGGFVNNIKSLINEFIEAKNKNKPERFIVYGSKNINMSDLPLSLAKYYNVPYLLIENVVDEYVANLVYKLQETNLSKDTQIETRSPLDISDFLSDGNTEGIRECADILNLDKALDIFKKLNTNEMKDTKMVSDTQKSYILKEKLLQNQCFHHGYVLNEFPQTLHQAEIIFPSVDRPNLGQDNILTECTLPDCIVVLNETQYTVVDENAEIAEIQPQNENIEFDTNKQHETPIDNEIAPEAKVNKSVDPVIKFFQEKNEKCKLIIINTTTTDKLETILNTIIAAIEGRIEEKQESDPYQESDSTAFKNPNASERDLSNMPNVEIENELFSKLKKQEETILSVKSYPFLNYLIKFVYPTLTNALLEVSKHRPENPLDFLSEYLFRENPHGRMIDPKQLISKDANQGLGFPNIDSKTCLS